MQVRAQKVEGGLISSQLSLHLRKLVLLHSLQFFAEPFTTDTSP